MRPVCALLLMFAVTGCEGGTGGSPDAGRHAYILLEPSSEQQGWDAIAAIRATLPPEERRRIRTAGLISSARPTMYIDFDGNCSGAAGFVASAKRVARESGLSRATCGTTLPGAL